MTMTKEEAIKWFRGSPVYHKDHEPYNMAIKALEQEPCEDAVSRDAVIKAVDSHTNEDGTLDDDISIILEDLPSVTPIRPKGEWIEIVDEETAYSKTWHYECSECRKNNTCFGGNPNFCPHCGADMRGEQE